MHHDILNLVRKKKVKMEVDEHYSILTCRGCGRKDEILGDIGIANLSYGWSTLSLWTLSNSKVSDWLLCPTCVSKVRISAGLDIKTR